MLTSNLAIKGVYNKVYAIIISGGKQYKVQEGEEVLLEKMEGKAGDKVEVGEVIFLSKNGDKVYEKDQLAKVKVKATIVEQTKDDKIIVFKYKPKKGYRRKRGHRQLLTKVMIDDINFPGKPAKKEKPKEVKKEVKEEAKPETKAKAKVKAKSPAKSKAKTTAKAAAKPDAKDSVKKTKTKKSADKTKKAEKKSK